MHSNDIFSRRGSCRYFGVPMILSLRVPSVKLHLDPFGTDHPKTPTTNSEKKCKKKQVFLGLEMAKTKNKKSNIQTFDEQ